MRFGLVVIGLVLVALGLFWLGQGTGYIMWPESSFMLRDMTWAYIGGGVAAIGFILLLLSGRR